MRQGRVPLVAGNWKMHKTSGEGAAFIERLAERVAALEDREVVVSPPFTGLYEAVRAARGTRVSVSSQDVFWETEGAYTGEIAARMLSDLGVKATIVGHSERRRLFGDTDVTAAKKVRAALDQGLSVILCVGETEGEREAGRTEEVLSIQVPAGLASVHSEEVGLVAIAYEPVWAIGTGKTATAESAQGAIAFVRTQVAAALGPAAAAVVRILYGGSVRPDNIDLLMAQPDIDGVLAAGASLDLDSFTRIVRFVKL